MNTEVLVFSRDLLRVDAAEDLSSPSTVTAERS
jgi:hypothetical protein